MRFKKLFTLIMILSLMLVNMPEIFADEQAEIILRALINAGVITQSDIDKAAAQVKQEREGEEAAAPQTINDRVTVLEEKAGKTPHWVQKTKLKGDLRLRHETITVHPGEDDNRERIRFRIGAATEVNDRTELGFGLATGSSDSPTSTNQTLESEFQSKAIWLDYAYAKYKPAGWLTLEGGKFKSPFFHTDMLWDSDIRFDGVAVTAAHKILENTNMPAELFLTAGYFPIDNNSAGESDVYLTAVQGGKNVRFGDAAKLKTGLAYYNFHGLEGYSTAALAEDRGTNTVSSGGIANDFQIISPTMTLTFNDLFGIGFPVSLIGEYAQNVVIANDDDNDAWRAGIGFGTTVKKKGDWELIIQYSRIERDAFFDAFPDADFNSGGANGRGWETILDYGIADNVILSLDYYNTAVVTGAENDQQIVQTDVMFMF